MNFIERVIAGESPNLYEAIDTWYVLRDHYDTNFPHVHEWLGLTWLEYNFLRTDQKTIVQILADRKEPT